MNFTELKRLAYKEADNLKLHCTPEELGMLNFDKLKPTHASSCIYGQMTGNCYNVRALQLIKKCNVSYILVDLEEFDNYQLTEEKREWESSIYSPIEAFIMQYDNAESKKLVEYLKQ